MTDQIDIDAIETEDDRTARSSRRRMLLAGAGIAGAAALAKAGTASADDGEGLVIGEENTAQSPTTLTNTESDDVFTAAGNGYGGEFEGSVAPVRLVPAAAPAEEADIAPTGDDHQQGELYVDSEGDLWFNTADGSEGWTKLNDQSPAGVTTFLPAPQRAYDSREEYPVPANTNKGRFGQEETRTIDLTEFTDFPAGASGALINLTADATGEAGWAFVFSDDVEVTTLSDLPIASSLNWYAPDQIVANTTFSAVSADGKVKVHTARPTEIIIDVIGYVS